MESTADDDTYYTVSEYLDRHPEIERLFSKQKIYAAIRGDLGDDRSPLAAARVGARRVYIRHADVIAYLEARTEAKAKPRTPLTPEKRAERTAKRLATLAARNVATQPDEPTPRRSRKAVQP